MEQAESPTPSPSSRRRGRGVDQLSVLGLDLGGAHVKAVHTQGQVKTFPLPLYRDPTVLTQRLQKLFREMPQANHLAVTMTGELCDCFVSRPQGVQHILQHLHAAARHKQVWIWSTRQRFLTLTEARRKPWQVASANWLATTAWVGSWLLHMHPQVRDVLLLDLGSTTLDVLPIIQGKPNPNGWTDFERMQQGELIYIGATRPPVMMYHAAGPSEKGKGWPIAAELFATMQDVYVVLGEVAEDPKDLFTADGRPRTRYWAEQRLARMWGADLSQLQAKDVLRQARQLAQRHQQHVLQSLHSAVKQMKKNKPAFQPSLVVAVGSGEFLLRRLQASFLTDIPWLFLSDHVGQAISTAAAAHAVTQLAAPWLLRRGQRS